MAADAEQSAPRTAGPGRLPIGEPQIEAGLPPAPPASAPVVGTLAPFRHPIFVLIWLASIASNFGTVIQAMAASWLMMSLSSSPAMVALVQTASALPVFCLALFSGAMADRFGKRPQMLGAQVLAVVAAGTLSFLVYRHMVGPWSLLFFTCLLGFAQAIYLPAWQSSIGEQVPREVVPAAVGINAVGFNLARCVAPIAGGVILKSLGPPPAFLINAVTFVGVILVILTWRGGRAPAGAQREPMLRAIRIGVSYVVFHPEIRATLQRCWLFSFIASASYAFLPLIARQLLHGDETTYTVALSSFGIGAIVMGLTMQTMRRLTTAHRLSVIASATSALAAIAIGLNLSVLLTFAALFVAGMAWVASFGTYNTAAQMLAPAWLAGRVVAAYQMAVFAGQAGGSAFWGAVSRLIGVPATLELAGGLMLAALLLIRGRALLADSSKRASGVRQYPLRPPQLAIDPEDGPIVIEISYQVDPERVPEFVAAARRLGQLRRRDGVRRWTLRRDLDTPERWTESFWLSSWSEQQIRAMRMTEEAEMVRAEVESFDVTGTRSIRRYLVRRDGDVVLD